MTAVQRNAGNSQKILKVVETKRLTQDHIQQALDGKLSEGATLITDKHPSYKAFGKDNTEITHKSVLAKDRVDKSQRGLHLQTVNQTHAQVRKFLQNFNGVSTKYLQNYLNWYAYQAEINKSKSVIKQWILTGLLSYQAYQLFTLFKQNAVNIRT